MSVAFKTPLVSRTDHCLKHTDREMRDSTMKPRIHVITLAVADLDRALAFYRDGLGFRTEGLIGTEFKGDETVTTGRGASTRDTSKIPTATSGRSSGTPRSTCPEWLRPKRGRDRDSGSLHTLGGVQRSTIFVGRAAYLAGGSHRTPQRRSSYGRSASHRAASVPARPRAGTQAQAGSGSARSP
jgi:catechol 2,3-dioxygenase-like lactoylglutathione lyase family enzyme